MTKYVAFFGSYFTEFRLNMKICEVNIRIQSEYRKIMTRKNSVFGHFHAVELTLKDKKNLYPRHYYFSVILS